MFAVILALLAVTTLYLRYLNRLHAKKRVAMGKKAQIVDMSLETAEEVQRLEQVQEEMRNQSSRTQGDDAEGVDEVPKPESNAFADLTDLENEDFVFVY